MFHNEASSNYNTRNQQACLPDAYEMEGVSYSAISHVEAPKLTVASYPDKSLTFSVTSTTDTDDEVSDCSLLKTSKNLNKDNFRDKFLYSFPLKGITIAVRLIGTALSVALIICGIFDSPMGHSSTFVKHIIRAIQILFGIILLLSVRRDDTFLSSFYNGMIDQAACLRRPSFLGLLYLLGALISIEGGWISRYLLCPSLCVYGFISLAVSFGGHYRVRKGLAGYGIYFMASNKLDKDEEVFTMTRNGKEFKMVAEIPNFQDPYNLTIYCCPKPEDLELLELAIFNDEMEIKNVPTCGQQSGPLWKKPNQSPK